MCGIFAYISKNYKEYNIIISEANKCNHRGPDNTKIEMNTYKNYSLTFVFHRLAINGLNPSGNQPMTINNITIICNGEIYNYRELANQYGIDLISDSDCEVIIHLYERLGIQCIKLLDGVFSFVLFDKENGLVYVGHDPIGIRSLYMIQDKDNIIIASEMKCLTYFQKDIKMRSLNILILYLILNIQMTVIQLLQFKNYFMIAFRNA